MVPAEPAILILGQFPIDIYKKPINFIFTFIIPIGVITTFPIKIFYSLLNWQSVIISFLISASFLSFSLFFWKKALSHYQSASS